MAWKPRHCQPGKEDHHTTAFVHQSAWPVLSSLCSVRQPIRGATLASTSSCDSAAQHAAEPPSRLAPELTRSAAHPGNVSHRYSPTSSANILPLNQYQLHAALAVSQCHRLRSAPDSDAHGNVEAASLAMWAAATSIHARLELNHTSLSHAAWLIAVPGGTGPADCVLPKGRIHDA